MYYYFASSRELSLYSCKRNETNARVLARESKLGVTSFVRSFDNEAAVARLRDGPPLSISRMQDRQKYKAAEQATTDDQNEASM